MVRWYQLITDQIAAPLIRAVSGCLVWGVGNTHHTHTHPLNFGREGVEWRRGGGGQVLYSASKLSPKVLFNHLGPPSKSTFREDLDAECRTRTWQK